MTGATVTNIAYTPSTTDASKLHVVAFTTTTDTTGMLSKLTLSNAGTAVAATSTCVTTSATLITCTFSPTDVPFVNFDKTGLTVVSQ